MQGILSETVVHLDKGAKSMMIWIWHECDAWRKLVLDDKVWTSGCQ
jgi:hypothetical protein